MLLFPMDAFPPPNHCPVFTDPSAFQSDSYQPALHTVYGLLWELSCCCCCCSSGQMDFDHKISSWSLSAKKVRQSKVKLNFHISSAVPNIVNSLVSSDFTGSFPNRGKLVEMWGNIINHARTKHVSNRLSWMLFGACSHGRHFPLTLPATNHLICCW